MRFVRAASHFVSKRAIWLSEAALAYAALPRTTQRIVGSWCHRSASFTSPYPVRRPNTDCRERFPCHRPRDSTDLSFIHESAVQSGQSISTFQ
jgi:hypothetical protein